MRIASSVISMILPNTMSPALNGGRSRGRGPRLLLALWLLAARLAGRSAPSASARPLRPAFAGGVAFGRAPRRPSRGRPARLALVALLRGDGDGASSSSGGSRGASSPGAPLAPRRRAASSPAASRRAPRRRRAPWTSRRRRRRRATRLQARPRAARRRVRARRLRRRESGAARFGGRTVARRARHRRSICRGVRGAEVPKRRESLAQTVAAFPVNSRRALTRRRRRA